MTDRREQESAGDPRIERVLGLLGLARRAGRLALGATAVEKMVRFGPPPVVVVAKDAGAGQRHRVQGLRPVRGVIDDLMTGADLANRFGRNELTIVAVNDPGFVRGLVEMGVVAEPRD
jgi:hypothetical protein